MQAPPLRSAVISLHSACVVPLRSAGPGMSRPAARSRGSTTYSGADQVVAETFKVLVLGSSEVGKTSLVRLYASGETATNLITTVGMDFTDVIVSVSGTSVRLRVWDTAGQEKFFTFTRQFFRGTQGIILMYDITSMASYQTLMKWMQAVRQAGLDNVVTVMVGNKVDLSTKREVPLETATKLASHNGFEYIETSAVTGTNARRAFYKLAEALIFSRGIFLPGEEADSHIRGDTLGGLTSEANHIIPKNSSFKLESEDIRESAQKSGSQRARNGKRTVNNAQKDSSSRCCS